jgi:hypothetical protein
MVVPCNFKTAGREIHIVVPEFQNTFVVRLRDVVRTIPRGPVHVVGTLKLGTVENEPDAPWGTWAWASIMDAQVAEIE